MEERLQLFWLGVRLAVWSQAPGFELSIKFLLGLPQARGSGLLGSVCRVHGPVKRFATAVAPVNTVVANTMGADVFESALVGPVLSGPPLWQYGVQAPIKSKPQCDGAPNGELICSKPFEKFYDSDPSFHSRDFTCGSWSLVQLGAVVEVPGERFELGLSNFSNTLLTDVEDDFVLEHR